MFGVDGVIRMDVRRVFQEYGTDIAQARVLVECNMCVVGA